MRFYSGADISGENSAHMGKCVNQHEKWSGDRCQVWLGLGNVRPWDHGDLVDPFCGTLLQTPYSAFQLLIIIGFVQHLHVGEGRYGYATASAAY